MKPRTLIGILLRACYWVHMISAAALITWAVGSLFLTGCGRQLDQSPAPPTLVHAAKAMTAPDTFVTIPEGLLLFAECQRMHSAHHARVEVVGSVTDPHAKRRPLECLALDPMGFVLSRAEVIGSFCWLSLPEGSSGTYAVTGDGVRTEITK